MTLAFDLTPHMARAAHQLNADESGATLRDRGMQLAIDFAGERWSDAIVAEFTTWAAQQKRAGHTWVTVEQFRAQTRNHPASANAWGSLPRLLRKAGVIAPTGEYVRAVAPKTHAHPVAKWALL